MCRSSGLLRFFRCGKSMVKLGARGEVVVLDADVRLLLLRCNAVPVLEYCTDSIEHSLLKDRQNTDTTLSREQ